MSRCVILAVAWCATFCSSSFAADGASSPQSDTITTRALVDHGGDGAAPRSPERQAEPDLPRISAPQPPRPPLPAARGGTEIAQTTPEPGRPASVAQAAPAAGVPPLPAQTEVPPAP